MNRTTAQPRQPAPASRRAANAHVTEGTQIRQPGSRIDRGSTLVPNIPNTSTEATAEFALPVFRASMRSGRFQKTARWTTNTAHSEADCLAKLAFLLSPLPEQTRIVVEVERRPERCGRVEVAVSANLKRAARLCQSILPKAFWRDYMRKPSPILNEKQ